MAKLTIEFDDNILAAAIVQAIGTGGATATVETESGDAISPEDFLALCDEAKAATSAKDVKEALAEFDFKTPKSAAKADDETLAEMVEVLNEMIGEDGADEDDEEEAEDDDDEEEDDEEDAVTFEDVKKASQAYAKENGKPALKEILEDFDLKSIAKAKDLDQDDLDELYAELNG